MNLELLGGFKVSGSKIRCTDPCYSKADTWCAANIAARPGTWKAYAAFKDFGPGGLGGRRCTHLLVVHESVRARSLNLKATDIHGGVDSGQFGFFDAKKFPLGQDREFEYSNEESFYRKVCKLTCKEIRVPDLQTVELFKARMSAAEYKRKVGDYMPMMTKTISSADVMEFGAVSSSGFGDGGYPVYALRDSGKAVALLAEYVNEDEQAEENAKELEVHLP